jgi:hypothetical protein
MRKVVQKRVRHSGDGLNVVADVNAVVAATTGRKGGGTAATAKRQSVRVVQKNGRTEVTEIEEDGTG